jgi:diguanylate cyclase (GGDEF)-like protein
MQDRTRDPRWLPALARLQDRLGPARTNAILSAAVLGVGLLAAAVVAVLSPAGAGQAALVSAAAVALIAGPLLVGALLVTNARLHSARQQLRQLATHDHLTGVSNRKHFVAMAERDWSSIRRYGTDGAVLMIDVDHFKQVNDRYGKPAGDAVLRRIAEVAAQALRQADLIGRWGGEELVVLLPHTDPMGALDVAERIRAQVSERKMEWNGAQFVCTVSVGVAPVGAVHETLESIVGDAEQALAEAKAAGRNCVRMAPIQPRRSGETYPVISR